MMVSNDEHDQAIKEFKTKVQECTVKGACGRDYVRVEALRNWMRSQVQDPSTGRNITQVDRLLRAVYRDRKSPGLPITAKEVDSRYLLVFSILLELESGKHIDSFKTVEISDLRLPETLYNLQKKIEAISGLNSSKLAEAFDQLQWRYRPVRLEMDMSPTCSEHAIIPICRKEPIKQGGTAKVWQILVQEEFVDHNLREAVWSDPHARIKDKVFGWVSSFICRVLTSL